MRFKIRNLKNYAFDFLSIFIAVISAFALNNWNDNRRDSRAESKILSEIFHGLEKDMDDVQLNFIGHKDGLKAGEFWTRMITGQEANLDSLQQYYFILLRDFVSIQNTSGYETLKSRGLELIKNDSLRTKIISLYEYDYQTLMKLEEEYGELQFHDNYFHDFNKIIAPHFEFSLNGNISGIKMPLDLSDTERNILLSYLWRIRVNRRFILQYYEEVQGKINSLSDEIQGELNS